MLPVDIVTWSKDEKHDQHFLIIPSPSAALSGLMILRKKVVAGKFPQSKQDSWWGGYHMLSGLVTRLFLEFCNDKIGPRSSCETLWLQQFWQGWNLCDVCKNDFCHISSLIPKMQTWQNIFHYRQWVINLNKFSHLSVFHLEECPFVVKPAQHFRRGQKCTLKSCKLLLQSPRSTSWICSWVLL